MSRPCEDCALPYEPAARNQRRCTPCRVLRDITYWLERAGKMPDAIAETRGVCCICSSPGFVVAGSPVCADCVLSSPDGMDELVQSQENRRAYAAMEPDPVVPARGSSEYELMVRRVWALGDSEPWIAEAEMRLRAVLGDIPVPRYLVLAAAMGRYGA